MNFKRANGQSWKNEMFTPFQKYGDRKITL